jgi:prepilin-type N-terminal cleavage/methylation domain-containing protein
MKKAENEPGFTLVEILVVIGVFVILAVLVSQSLATTLRSSKKSESQVIVRENLSHVISVMERQLINARQIDIPNGTDIYLPYVDQYNDFAYFECMSDANGVGYIASGSALARLTSTSVDVNCANIFSYHPKVAGNPESVEILLQADRAELSGVEDTSVSVATRVVLRTYERF